MCSSDLLRVKPRLRTRVRKPTLRKRVPIRRTITKPKRPLTTTLIKIKKKKHKIIKRIDIELKKKKMIYLPDFWSQLWGIRVGSIKEKQNLLRRGRVFSGLERRAIV